EFLVVPFHIGCGQSRNAAVKRGETGSRSIIRREPGHASNSVEHPLAALAYHDKTGLLSGDWPLPHVRLAVDLERKFPVAVRGAKRAGVEAFGHVVRCTFVMVAHQGHYVGYSECPIWFDKKRVVLGTGLPPEVGVGKLLRARGPPVDAPDAP